MNKPIRFLSILTIVAMAFFFLNAIGVTNIQLLKNVSEKYEIKAVKLPTYLEFAGEPVPLEKPHVKERMDRELLVNTYWQSNGLLLIKRANKWFPVLEPLLEKYGLPDDFKYLAVAESALIDETSSAGAAGMWHFMRGTAKEYGMEVNKNVDERYNVELATKNAAKYLQKSKDRLGSWTLAAAAYNAGNHGVSKRLKTQQVNNYYDALLANETQRYVFRIIALKEIMTYPEKYGFVFDAEDLYQPEETYTIKVDTAISNIATFAKKYGLTYKEFKRHNSWLRENHLNNKSKKVYYIKIPK